MKLRQPGEKDVQSAKRFLNFYVFSNKIRRIVLLDK